MAKEKDGLTVNEDALPLYLREVVAALKRLDEKRGRRDFWPAYMVGEECGKSVSTALRNLHKLADMGLVVIARYANNSVHARLKEAGHDD